MRPRKFQAIYGATWLGLPANGSASRKGAASRGRAGAEQQPRADSSSSLSLYRLGELCRKRAVIPPPPNTPAAGVPVWSRQWPAGVGALAKIILRAGVALEESTK